MSGWKLGRAGWLKTYHRQKRMQRWITENGIPSEKEEEEKKKEWLAKNAVTICPPFGHNSKGD